MLNNKEKNIVQGLWIGDNLSPMEQLSLASFVKNGHEYHFYVYEDVDNVPDGVVVKDGNDILPESMIFAYKNGEGKGSFSAFSNYFRYKLLLDKGGWWADTDMVCIKPLDFKQDHVFATELYMNEDYITSGIIKAEKGSEVMNYCWNVCKSKDPDAIVWGEVGPSLIRNAVNKRLPQYKKNVVKPNVFCPVGFEQWTDFINPNKKLTFEDDTYCIHMWNEMWRRYLADKEKTYNKNCLYEQLKEKYL